MFKRIFCALLLIVSSGLSKSNAQSNPGLYQGQIPSAVQWNSYFSAKEDYFNITGLVKGNGTAAPSTAVPAVDYVAPNGSGASLTSLNANNISTGTLAVARLPVIPNSSLAYSSTTVNGQTCTLGASCTISAAATGVTVGTTTISAGTNGYVLFNNAGVLGNIATLPSANGGTGINNGTSTLTLGASLTTTGTGGATLAFPSTSTTYAFPTVAGTLATGASSPLALNATTGNLTCPTCATTSGGGSISTLTFGTHLTAGGSSYNGSSAVTLSSDATNANTASAIVARDGSGNFSAGTITAALNGNASTATSATNATNGATVAVTSNASYYVLLAAASTNSNQPFNLGSGLTFNPSTNALSTTTFIGALTGHASLDLAVSSLGTGVQTALGNAVNGTGGLAAANASTTVNGTTCTLNSSCTITATAGAITVGTTSVASGNSGYILYDNAGTLGNLATTGTGNVVLAASPTLTTPTLAYGTGSNQFIIASSSNAGYTNAFASENAGSFSGATLVDASFVAALTGNSCTTCTVTTSILGVSGSATGLITTGAGVAGGLDIATGAGNILLQPGGATAATLTGGGGLQIGAPTGGDKGVGSINVQSCYVNNVACVANNGTTGTGSVVLATSPIIAGLTMSGNIAMGSNAITGVSAPAQGNSSTQAITSAWYGQNLPGGLINKFRNGTFDTWQRGTSATTISTSGSYFADGWRVLFSGSSSVTALQATGTGGALYALEIEGATGNTDIKVGQRIESYVAAPLAGNVVTGQFWYYQNTGSTVTPKISTCYASAQDNFGTCTSDLAAVGLTSCATATWCLEAYTFTASANASNGYEVDFDCNAGFTTISVNCKFTAADIRVTPGVTANTIPANPPPPELRPVFAEASFNARYYRINPYLVGGWSSASLTGFVAAWSFDNPMRVAPTLALINGTNAVTQFNVVTLNASAVTSYSPQTNGIGLGLTTGSANNSYTLLGVVNSGAVSASAEL